MLAGEGSSRPDCFNIMGNQAFHIYMRYTVMDAEEVSANLKTFCKVSLILMFGIAFFNHNIGDNLRTEIVKYGTRPNLLKDIFVLFGMERFKTKRIFEITERVFLSPSQMIQFLEIHPGDW